VAILVVCLWWAGAAGKAVGASVTATVWGQESTPEAFGARGDGRTDDFDAIAACLKKFNRCDFGPRVYVVRDRLPVTHGTVLRGQGKDRTVVRLADNSEAALTFPNLFAVVGNIPYSTANGARISDLTIDCNFAGQRVPGKEWLATLGAVALWGSSNLVENVKAVNFQVGKNGHECFVFSTVLSPAQNGLPGNTIRRCEVTGVADNAGLVYPAPPIVTCIANGGSSNTNLALGPVVELCFIHDMTTHPTRQTSMLHGITPGAAREAVIRNNEVRQFYGNAIYQDTWILMDSSITDNRLLQVRYGIYLVAPVQPNGGAYRGVLIARNEIVLAGARLKYDAARLYANQQRGIYFYNQPRYEGVVIRDNRIEGRAWRTRGRTYRPEGIHWLLTTQSRSGFVVTNNIVRVPSAR
jgi:hypothetical protein